MQVEKSELHTRSELLQFVPPMLVGYPDKRNLPKIDWDSRIYEPKADGYRLEALVKSNPYGDSAVQLISKSEIEYTSKFGRVVKDLASLKCDVILDGEIEAVQDIDSQPEPTNEIERELTQIYLGAVPNRNLLQRSPLHLASVDYRYIVFDILFLDGKPTTDLPLIERKKVLKDVLKNDLDSVIEMPYFEHEDAAEFFSAVHKLKLEGMIAKRRNSIYYPGKRNYNWLKFKITDFA